MRGNQHAQRHSAIASTAPSKTGQSAFHSTAGESGSGSVPLGTVRYSVHGTTSEATAVASQGQTSPAAAVVCGSRDAVLARLRKNCNISSVVPTCAGMIKTFGEAADPPGLQIILEKMRPAPNPHLRICV